MKKTVSILTLTLALQAQAQTSVADFENLVLPAGSSYTSASSTPFTAGSASFEHQYNSSFDYWSGGFSYTNKYDSSTAGFTNLHGVKAYKGYNGSDIYVVGQDGGTVRTTVSQATVNGFYLTNTTYAFKSMRDGDQFARKFGDTTGTGSGTTIAQGSYPDYFKVVVKGYDNGSVKSDSVEFFLADFRFTNNNQDYIADSWVYCNTSALGQVDSIRFILRSSDMSNGFMNTPAFFALDNFTVSGDQVTGIPGNSYANNLEFYPNPCDAAVRVRLNAPHDPPYTLQIFGIDGRSLAAPVPVNDRELVNVDFLPSGLYMVRATNGERVITGKLIRR